MRKICNIYRSEKEEGMYLYVDKKDELLSIPEDLLKKFGKPTLVMTLMITREKKLARVDSKHVLEMIEKNGFYLQFPPLVSSDMTWLHNKNSKL